MIEWIICGIWGEIQELTAVLSEQARVDLRYYLTNTLLELLGSCLQYDLALFAGGGAVPQWESSGQSHEAWRVAMLSGRWEALLRALPVVGRVIATFWSNFVAAYTEFRRRLLDDSAALGLEPGASACVQRLVWGLSDRHEAGRTVVAVLLNNGRTVLYKPRAGSCDMAWRHAVAGLVDMGLPYRLEVLSSTHRDGYHWADAVVATADHSTGEQRANFYEHAGALLAIAAFLGLRDLHFENVIAVSSQLVPVDVECIFYHGDLSHIPDPLFARASGPIHLSSLQATCLLPEWNGRPGEEGIDVSGILGRAHEAKWRYPERVRNALLNQSGEPFDPFSEHVETHICRGYMRAAQWLTEIVRCHPSQVANLVPRTGKSRHLFRSTTNYYRALERAMRPDALASGVRWGIALEIIAFDERMDALAFDVFSAEVDQLHALDIPKFYVELGACHVEYVGAVRTQQIPGILRRSYLADWVNVASSLTPGDVEVGRQFLNVTFAAWRSNRARDAARDHAPIVLGDTSGPAVVCHDIDAKSQRLVVVDRVLTSLCSNAIWTDDRCYLVSVIFDERWGKWATALLGNGFYHGLPGVALAVAAWAAKSGAGIGERTAKGLLRAAMRVGVGERDNQFQRLLALYPTATASHLLAWDEGFELCRSTIEGMEAHHNQWQDRPHDLIDGLAGVIAATRALDRIGIPTSKLVALAEVVGRKALQPGTHAAAWPDRKGRLLTGMSHGASGVALALVQAGLTAGRTDLLDLAARAYRYEDSVFDPAADNWPDFRVQERAFGCSWCHGAPGIALSRLSVQRMLSQWGRPHPELEDALAITRTVGRAMARLRRGPSVEIPDCACCGWAGHFEVLQAWGDGDGAGAIIDDIVERAGTKTSFWTMPGLPDGLPLRSFFMGDAGISFSILRSIWPDLPCALAFE